MRWNRRQDLLPNRQNGGKTVPRTPFHLVGNICMKPAVACLAFVVFAAACGPRVPPITSDPFSSDNGVFAAPPAVSASPLGAPGADDLAAAGIGQGALDAASNPSISDEQSFSAVTGRETIQSDAERRAAQAAARQVIAPQPIPQRPTDTGPNIVEYALNAPNAKGQEWYSRLLISGQGRFLRNCARYATADEAQRDFLARGGPERDPRGIDPDGDGFACGWDPAPFRAAVRS
jgi:hypothetical protein